MTSPGTEPISDPAPSPLKVQGFSPHDDHGKLDVLRYVPLERFLSLLEFEAMWFSRLGALQDKFESRNPQGFGAKVLALDALSKKDDELNYRLHAGPWPEMVAAAEHSRSGDEGRQMGAVNCWFLGKLESHTMWKEYGDGGKGIAIRSTVERLTTAFQITGTYALVSRVGRINYVDFQNHDLGNHANDMVHVAFIKDKAYEQEHEVRIVTMNSFHSGCLYPDGSQAGGPGALVFSPEIKGLYIKCNIRRLIRSIIVGPNTESSFRMLMKRILGRYGLSIDVEYSQVPPRL